MKLPIAIAVLFLVFAANTEAKEEEITQEESVFGNQMTKLFEDVAQKTKSTIEDIHNSDFAVNTRNWFSEQLQRMKGKVEETFPQQ